MSNSGDSYVRLMAAQNPNTPLDALKRLSHDEHSTVRSAVGKNPSTPMSLLISMIRDPDETAPTSGWIEIAERQDLTEDVFDAFSQISVKNAAYFADKIVSPVRNGYWAPSITPRVLSILASIKDTRKPLPFGSPDNRVEFLYPPSIQLSLAELGNHLDEQTMLILAHAEDVDVHRALVTSIGNALPKNVALTLSKSEDTKVLDRLLSCIHLNESETIPIRERLSSRPEWIEQQEELNRVLDRSKIVDFETGKVIQEAALDSRIFDSPVEEIFWNAYRKSVPSALDGLVAQYVVSRYRLDFAIPERMIGIEIDGHQYHSSPDDIAKDRKRQQELEGNGWRIVRFTATNVRHDANKCVQQAALWASSRL